jgi:predicted Zn-dependent protease
LERDPRDPGLNAQLATALLAQGKNDEALPVLETLRQLEPGNASVDQMLADAYSQAGHPEKADPIYARMALAHPIMRIFWPGRAKTCSGRGFIPRPRRCWSGQSSSNPTTGTPGAAWPLPLRKISSIQ